MLRKVSWVQDKKRNIALKRGIKSSKQGWGYSSIVKYLNSMYKALNSLSSTGKEKNHTHTHPSK